MSLCVLLCAAVESTYNTPQEIDTTDVEAWEDRYFIREEVSGCYSRMNELSVNMDSNQICVTLDSLKKAACRVFPEGVFVDVELSNNNGITIRMKDEAFNYDTTAEVCAACPIRTVSVSPGVLQQKSDCAILQGTDAARVTLKSLTKWAEITIGKISIGHSQYTKCFDSSQAKLYLAKTSARLQIVSNNLCVNVRRQCSEQYYQIDMLFKLENGTRVLRSVSKSVNNLSFVLNGYAVTLTMDGTFADLIELAIEDVELKLYLGCNVTAIFITYCFAILSKELEEPFLNPYLRIWPDRLTITASAIPQAAEYDALYYDQMKCYKASVQFYDTINQKMLAVFDLSGKQFSFINVQRRTFKCSSTSDPTTCMYKTAELLEVDTTQMRVYSSYWFYENADCTNLITYATAYITSVRDTCWSGTIVVFKTGAVCVRPEINPHYTYCDFINSTDSLFTITVGSAEYSVRSTYSIETYEVCYECDNDECTYNLANAWKIHDTITLLLVDKTTNTDFDLPVTATFSEDYSALFDFITIMAIVLAVVMVLILVLAVLRDLQLCAKVGKRKEIQVEKLDEL